jgi:hypothetical protein
MQHDMHYDLIISRRAEGGIVQHMLSMYKALGSIPIVKKVVVIIITRAKMIIISKNLHQKLMVVGITTAEKIKMKMSKWRTKHSGSWL